MTAAYRLKGIGWFAGIVAIVLGFYLVSLQVAAERKKLEGLNARIAAAQRDIRALETEFDTRANLAQLERWNGDTLALAAPTAAQYVGDEAQLAAIDVSAIPAVTPGIKTAQLVVPAAAVLPTTGPSLKPAMVPAVTVAAVRPPVSPAGIPHHATLASDPLPHAMSGGSPAIVGLERAHRATAAVATLRPQTLANLDRKLLSDSTLGAILTGARAESGRRH